MTEIKTKILIIKVQMNKLVFSRRFQLRVILIDVYFNLFI
jgi:hypothetical protein